MNSETSAALDSLQSAPLTKHEKAFNWLDKHKEDVLAVLVEKSVSLTEELLGLKRTTIFAWRSSRHLTAEKAPSGRLIPEASAEYWRGKAEAYREILEWLILEHAKAGNRTT